MSMNLSAGKAAGLDAVSDERGIIAAAAMDQRGLLEQMLTKALGGRKTDCGDDVRIQGDRRAHLDKIRFVHSPRCAIQPEGNQEY